MLKHKATIKLLFVVGIATLMLTPSNITFTTSAFIPIDGCPTNNWYTTSAEYTDQYLGRVELTDTAASSVKTVLIEPQITDLRTDPSEQIFTSRYSTSSTLKESMTFSTSVSGSLSGKMSAGFELFDVGINVGSGVTLGESSTESNTFTQSYTLSSSMKISNDVNDIDGNYNGQDIDAKFILHAVTYKADAYITKINTLHYYWEEGPGGVCDITYDVVDSTYSVGYVIVDATEVYSVQEGVPYIVGNTNTPFYSVTSQAYNNIVNGGNLRKEQVVTDVNRYQGSYSLSSSATTQSTAMSLTSNWVSMSSSFSASFLDLIKASVSFNINLQVSNTISATSTTVVNDVIEGTINCNPMVINAWRTVYDTLYFTGLCQDPFVPSEPIPKL